MDVMPKAYDKFTVETWVESAMKYFTGRNFAIRSADGRVCGYGKSIWAMIDTVTRQPVDILSINDGLVLEYVEKDKPCPIDKPGRARVGEGAKLVRTVDTYYNDVDINGHINSIKYIEHVLDLFDKICAPFTSHGEHRRYGSQGRHNSPCRQQRELQKARASL